VLEGWRPWRFNRKRGAWSRKAPDGRTAGVSRLTAVTFNIWFSESHRRERLDALLETVRRRDPDIIALQEVTPEVLGRILAVDWIREAYTASDAMGDTVDPYGALLLARVPCAKYVAHDLPSMMGRRLLVADLLVEGGSFHAATVHLESTRSMAPLRREQLLRIGPILRRSDHALLTGDFNFCSSWPAENGLIEPDLVDVWPLLRRDEPGWTLDPGRNPLRPEGEDPVRFDRILLRSTGGLWRPASIEIIGTEPVSPDLPGVLPSDHLGLAATFERRSD